MTPGLRAWLIKCRDHWPANRARGNVGYRAMAEGLTEWNYVDAEGNNLTFDEAKRRFGDACWDHVTSNGERITERGLKALENE